MNRQAPLVVLALLLYLLLLDAAAETFFSGASVRWWVVGIVAAYVGVTVRFWRRLGWPSIVLYSSVILLGLLAFTSWLPDGMTQGTRMLGQDTSTVLGLLTGCAVIVAGIAGTRFGFLPRGAKVPIAALTAYAALAFGLAIIGGIPYPDLFRGQSFWGVLPFWLQGAFIGTFILLPGVLLVHVARTFQGIRRASPINWGIQVLATALVLIIAMAGLTTPQPIREGGLRGDAGKSPLQGISLPVPRTLEMTHVEPAHFAHALSRDPDRIFEFVRDQVTYEAYAGSLRGPRGTLLALAGNSVDRALLLASLLQQAGHRVRYARGSLGQREVDRLLNSMWVKRPRATRAEQNSSSTEVRARWETLLTSIKHDYSLIQDLLKREAVGRGQLLTREALAKEAVAHYWVQWSKSGNWIDLDPLFPEARPGRTYAQPQEYLDSLPETLYHRVTLRLRLEEYARGEPASTRDILTYQARAADLSGTGVLLSHQPENWNGPVTSKPTGIAAAIQDTGRVKPVLIVGEKTIAGEPFRNRLTVGGIRGVSSRLRGEGTRKPLTVATAEFLEVDFINAGGQQSKVVREIFDLVGKGRRAAGRTLTEEEILSRTEGDKAFDVTDAIYSLTFATGHLREAHLPAAHEIPQQEDASDLGNGLRRLGIAFLIASDSLLAHVDIPGLGVVRSYSESPRLVIIEFSTKPVPRIALDLRQDHARVLPLSFAPEHFLAGQLVRGVVDGALERGLMEHVAAQTRQFGVATAMSTSLLFDRARAERVPILVLPREGARLQQVPEETLARLREEESRGYLAITPQRAITIEGVPRLAWWRVDPRSGQTTAVTDDGLHGGAPVGPQYIILHNISLRQTTVILVEYVGGRAVYLAMGGGAFAWGTRWLGMYIAQAVASGNFVERAIACGPCAMRYEGTSNVPRPEPSRLP